MVGHGLEVFQIMQQKSSDLALPDLGGSLDKTVKSSAIEEASNKVTTIIADPFKPFFHCKAAKALLFAS